jgi:hypothetical protein
VLAACAARLGIYAWHAALEELGKGSCQTGEGLVISMYGVRHRLATFASLAIAVSLLAICSPVGHFPEARADVAAGSLVFSQHDSQGDSHIVYLNSDGSEQALTSFGQDQAENPDVSLDGSKIAFDDTLYTYNSQGQVDGGGDGIWAMNSDGSSQTQLTFPNVTAADTSSAHFYDTLPVWSPDGTKIAFDRETYDAKFDAWIYRIFVMNADGTGLSQLTAPSSKYGYTDPVWSPDGTEIAYSRCALTCEIYVANTDGSGAHLAYRGAIAGLDWSADGRMWIWDDDAGDMTLAYLTSTDDFASASHTTETSVLYVGPAPVGDIRASGDGSTVYYSEDGDIYEEAYSAGSWTSTEITSSGTDQDPTPVDATWSPEHFAVLGDSFSSGEGNPPFIPPSGKDKCDRSYRAYAEDLNNTPTGMSLTGFAACSGATTGDVITGYDGESSQLGSISSSDNFVILTVGGDDMGFAQFVEDCVNPAVGCAEGSPAYNNAEDAIEDALPSNLATLFDQIAALVSPGTRVLVLGYPEELPPTGASQICSGVGAASQTGAEQVEGDLNAAIAAAVSSYGAPFEYVDPYDQFEGHQLCSSDPYFNGLNLIHQSYSYHPNGQGQQAYARAVETYLADHPTAP